MAIAAFVFGTSVLAVELLDSDEPAHGAGNPAFVAPAVTGTAERGTIQE